MKINKDLLSGSNSLAVAENKKTDVEMQEMTVTY
jgi:hypothetical protein